MESVNEPHSEENNTQTEGFYKLKIQDGEETCTNFGIKDVENVNIEAFLEHQPTNFPLEKT